MTIANILKELEKENMEAKISLEKLANRSLHEIGCDNIAWTDFVVQDKSVKKVKKLLEKQQVQHLLAAALKMSECDAVEVTEIITVDTDATFDEISYCVDKNRLLVFIFFSRSTKKFLK